MIESLDELSTILEGTELAERQLAKMNILDTREQALVVEANLSNSLKSWELLRSLVPVTGRWPVILADFEKGSNWKNSVESDAYTFSRFGYEYGYDENGFYGKVNHDISPRSIITRSQALDLDSVLQSLSKELEELEKKIL